MAKKINIVLGVTASISIYKSCELVRRLRDVGFQVSVVMTKEAQELIRPIVFQSLSGNKIYTELFTLPDVWEVEHISLAKLADLVLVAPATANIIGKVASGICDDLLTCIISATKAPVIFCPAMNENMYTNRITQGNIVMLKKLGYKFVEPRRGKLACGEVGVGCLAEIETVIREVKKVV